MKGYKGFAPGLVCRGKQYAENTVFEEPNADICKSGMHFCVNPFDVLDHYDLVNEDGSFNDFAEVEALDEAKTDDKKKYCTTKLRVGAKLSFGGFINACVDFILDKTKGKNESGNWARIGASGNWASIGASGYGASIGASGNWARIGASGNWARIGSSGDGASIGASGNWARIGSSGNGASIGASGQDSVICCAGHGSKVKAKKGSWITLAEWQYDDTKGRWVPVCVKTEQVDGERIKEDVFYELKDGEFVEVEL